MHKRRSCFIILILGLIADHIFGPGKDNLFALHYISKKEAIRLFSTENKTTYILHNIYMCVYVYIYKYIYIYMNVPMSACIYLCRHVYIYAWLYVSM